MKIMVPYLSPMGDKDVGGQLILNKEVISRLAVLNHIKGELVPGSRAGCLNEILMN